MQPKRDPSDRRFWPVRLGGIGTGFTHKDRSNHPYRYGALKRRNSLSPRPVPSRVSAQATKDAIQLVTEEALRARARTVSLNILDDLDNVRSSMDSKALTDALKATSVLATEKSSTVHVSGSVAHLHLDALRQLSAERRLSNSSTDTATASARMLPKSIDDSGLVEVEGDSASLGQESDGGEGAETLGRS